MFTGLIEEIGFIASPTDNPQEALRITCATILQDIRPGDSVAIDGVCLTAVNCDSNGFSVELSPETMHKTLLRQKKKGDAVNLERALLAGKRLGGHIVQGHIDGLLTVHNIVEQERCREITFSCDEVSETLLVEKGSVAINGVSLTVARKTGLLFTVALIPETLMRTNLTELKINDAVHLEPDILGKYVSAMTHAYLTKK